MRKFNGIPKAQFGLYLKECEWRFDNSEPSSKIIIWVSPLNSAQKKPSNDGNKQG